MRIVRAGSQADRRRARTQGGGMTGRVALVGAGPGDPELLTLKAVRALASADVVLHDDLVARPILDLVRSDARVIAVGKRGGCASTPQVFIEQLMIREARAGRFVVRLKGGDPFVFGRGGEEMLALREAGIEVAIVPGITSGLAAPASAGVPVTHRSVAHGVALVTAHAAEDGAEPDWRALAASGLTLVVYMGMQRIEALRDKLVAAGKAAATPVVIVANATRDDERSLHTTLARMADDAACASLHSPAIIVIGDVAAIAGQAGSVAAAGADSQMPWSTSSSARITGSSSR
jgi:uroporphyrin-III C-methyltransferase